MQQKIVAFVGMMGSGKGTAANYVAKLNNYPIYHFGNMVYEEVERRGLDNVKDEIFVRADMRAKEGPAVIAKHILRKITQDKPDQKLVILDGLYTWSEFKFLEEKYQENLVIVALVANKKLRRQRILNRKDGHRAYTLPQIIEREIDEIENMQKGSPIAYADYYVLNNLDNTDLESQLDIIHDQLLS